ncbi:hypothetical protein Y032_0034g2963 [Ancylostoma ceylanicum]|nr:hypothetical protein Y032_0034g2963 [Ancylostoma ceylanicum]
MIHQQYRKHSHLFISSFGKLRGGSACFERHRQDFRTASYALYSFSRNCILNRFFNSTHPVFQMIVPQASEMKLLLITLCVLICCTAEEYDGLRCQHPTAVGENCKSPKIRFTYDRSTGMCKEVKCCKECEKTKNIFNTMQECSGSCVIF